MGEITRKLTTLGLAGVIAGLALTGCAPQASDTGSGDKGTESSREAPAEKEGEKTQAPKVEVALTDPSATGDYGPRWVDEFGLPQVRNLNVGGVVDQSEASGYTTVTLLADPASPDVIAAYGDLLVQMGWSADGERVNENGLPQQDWHIEEDGGLMRSITVISDTEMGFTKFVYMELQLG